MGTESEGESHLSKIPDGLRKTRMAGRRDGGHRW